MVHCVHIYTIPYSKQSAVGCNASDVKMSKFKQILLFNVRALYSV